MMNNRSDNLDQYYELLTMFEDSIKTGFRREHGHPVFRKTAPSGSREECLASVARAVSICTRCNLCHNRLRAVCGEGQLDAAVLVVGEAPSVDEDNSGRPFTGAAGGYLDKWLAAVGLSRENGCFLANIVRCRPPDSRDPRPEETTACLSFLEAQIELVRPRAILTAGRIASQVLLGETRGIASLRGGSYFYKKIPLVATYNPATVLRDLSLRAPVWEDLKRLKAFLYSE